MAIEARPVDVKLRRGVDAVPDALSHIALHTCRVGIAGDLADEPAGIKVDPLGVAHQRVKVQAGRGPQQELVHCPEFPLRSGCLGRFGGLLRARYMVVRRDYR
jgi:hypothetical protein